LRSRPGTTSTCIRAVELLDQGCPADLALDILI